MVTLQSNIVANPQSIDFLQGKTFYEQVCTERLKALKASTKIKAKERACQAALWNARTLNVEGKLEVTYKTANKGTVQYGRVYASASLGDVSGPLRTYLLHDMYMPLDFENAHPSIVYQIAKTEGWPCDALGEYCRNRERILEKTMKDYGVTRKMAKELFITLTFSGNFNTWARNVSRGKSKLYPTPFVHRFAEDMQRVSHRISAVNDHVRRNIKPNERAKKNNAGSSPAKKARAEASEEQVVSYVCQEYERLAMGALLEFLINEGVVDAEKPECMLRFDGIDVLLASWFKLADHNNFLRRAEEYIRTRTALEMRLTTKPYVKDTAFAAEVEKQARDVLETGKTLDTNVLNRLKTYPRMKTYFERFIVKSMNSSNFVWLQKDLSDFPLVTELPRKALEISFEHFVYEEEVEEQEQGSEAGKGKVKKGKFITRWLKDPEMRAIDKTIFWPFNEDLEDPPSANFFNLFQGFAVKKDVPLEADDEKYLRPFHYLGLHMCENNPVSYQFLIYRLAFLVQQPRNRVPLAFVFQDKPQGNGADTFFNAVGNMLGKVHYNASSNIFDFFGDHAEGLERKLLVVMNEVQFAESSDLQSRIKDLVTCKKITVNAKHQRPRDTKVFALLVFVSNVFNAVRFDNADNERRFVVWNPSRAPIGAITAEEWAFLNQRLFASDCFVLALYKYLTEKVCLHDVDLVRFRPVVLTKSYFRASEANAPLHAKFFAHLIKKLADENQKEGSTDPSNHFNCIRPDAGRIQDIRTALAAARQAWEPEGFESLPAQVEFNSSDLSTMYQKFVSEVIGHNARRSGFNSALFASKYAGVVERVKKSVFVVRFGPRKLWEHLARNKWVSEGLELHKIGIQEDQKAFEAHIDPLFFELAKQASDPHLGLDALKAQLDS